MDEINQQPQNQMNFGTSGANFAGSPVHPLGAPMSGPDGLPASQVGFLLKYRKMQEDIDYSITKQFKVEINVVPNDLPRELAERRLVLEDYDK